MKSWNDALKEQYRDHCDTIKYQNSYSEQKQYHYYYYHYLFSG